MSERGVEFANEWIAENIRAEPYDPGDAVIAETVERLLEDATEAGVTREEIEEDLGDLTDLIADAFDEAADGDADRFVDEED
ncbi:DUF768 domain-containing protein [Sphingobium ummariense]